MVSAWTRRLGPLLAAAAVAVTALLGVSGPAHATDTPDQKMKVCQENSSLDLRATIACIAKSQDGIAEGKGGAYSCQKYFRDFGSNLNCNDDQNGQWCAAFTRWVWTKAGVKDVPKSFGVQEWAHALKRDSTPQVGDVGVFPSGEHIGVIVEVNKGTVVTREGNSSDKVNTHTLKTDYLKYYKVPGGSPSHPKPTGKPTTKPTGKPTGKPTDKPTGKPTDKPTGRPSDTSAPSGQPSSSVIVVPPSSSAPAQGSGGGSGALPVTGTSIGLIAGGGALLLGGGALLLMVIRKRRASA